VSITRSSIVGSRPRRCTAGSLGLSAIPRRREGSRNAGQSTRSVFGSTSCRLWSGRFNPYGIAIDGIRYYGDVLRRFIGASTDGRKRSFLFRRDPRDISTVYFWDAESQRYCAIPYRNTTYPAMSLWELREIRRKLGESGEAQVDEVAIFAAYARLREHESRATTETKRARRVRVRLPVATPALPSSEPAEPALLSDPPDIVPFAIEELL
jgi:hypothetical protein